MALSTFLLGVFLYGLMLGGQIPGVGGGILVFMFCFNRCVTRYTTEVGVGIVTDWFMLLG